MKPIHIAHLSTYPVQDIRIFQKACAFEVAEGYQVTQIVPAEHDETLGGVSIRSVRPPRSRFDRMVGLPLRMYRLAESLDADLYQFHHPDLMLAGALLKLTGKRVIYETREFFPDKILSMHWISRRLRPPVSKLFGWYERLTSLLWDHILVADRYTARAFAGRPVTVIPNYPLLVPVPRRQLNRGSERTLIYVGGLSEDRGLSVMLRIAELLGPAGVHLELMGPCAFPGDLERIRRAPYVTYMGTQSLTAVYERICAADLGLLLLQPVPAYTYAGENTLKLFEYMWCELPLLSSDFPNLREIVHGAQCGLCVDPCDSDYAAQCIRDLLDDPEQLLAMGRKGRNAVLKAYNWPAASELLGLVYRDVMAGHRRPTEPLPMWHPQTTPTAEI